MQLIEEWEKSVNSYSQDYTEEYELFISGSSSRMLSGELATLLSGRYVQFPVYPFSYQEYAEIRHLEQNRESYMNTGGIPELFVLPEKQEVQRNYLSALKDTILLKLAKTGWTDEVSRKKFQDAWVSPKNTRKYRAT